MERFYDPNTGLVLLDGRNTKDLDIKWLRSTLGLVSQEPVIFSRSIKDNIKYGLKKDVTDKDIVYAATKANIHSFISSLPQVRLTYFMLFRPVSKKCIRDRLHNRVQDLCDRVSLFFQTSCYLIDADMQ